MSPYPSFDSQDSQIDTSDSKSIVASNTPLEAQHDDQPKRFKWAYRQLSTKLGFKERFSLTFFVLFGGALFGFCMSRLMMLAPSNVVTKTVPGEWYWYRQALYKPNIFMHIYMSIVGGTLAVFQFIPVIRRRKMILHRINGYVVFFTLIPGSVAGSIVARRAFGGDLNSETAYYTLGFMIGPAGMLGVYFARVDTALHREWMLRMTLWLAILIHLAGTELYIYLTKSYTKPVQPPKAPPEDEKV
ncbi:hypothetical protein FRC06_007595 [Ceratobasidium sp. 370]|nr:hypothetical protein FRC06_007595 [Ceratobasidium sp. 370]